MNCHVELQLEAWLGSQVDAIKSMFFWSSDMSWFQLNLTIRSQHAETKTYQCLRQVRTQGRGWSMATTRPHPRRPFDSWNLRTLLCFNIFIHLMLEASLFGTWYIPNVWYKTGKNSLGRGIDPCLRFWHQDLNP